MKKNHPVFWFGFQGLCSTGPPQFYLHPFHSLCELQLILWQFLLLQKTVFNSYSHMNWKWNWKGGNIQIFSSEIILAWENGSQGHNFGQILNSNFLKSLRHSALSHYSVVNVVHETWKYLITPVTVKCGKCGSQNNGGRNWQKNVFCASYDLQLLKILLNHTSYSSV